MTKKKVLIAEPLCPEGIEILEQEGNLEVHQRFNLTPQQLMETIGPYEGLVVRSQTQVTQEVIDAAKSLVAIGRAGVGVDNIDLHAATRKGIVVMNSPAANTISTAEHTLSLLLSLARKIPQAHSALRARKWERNKFTGTELYGKTLGIIGLGRVGSEVAKRAQGLGMKVIAHDPSISPERANRLKVDLLSMEEVLKTSDFITIHAPLSPETYHLIGPKQLEMMKQGVMVINCARGGIIDETALFKAIKEGKVKGAALDVYEQEPPFESPLLELDEVISTPHLGASTQEAQIHVAVDIARQMLSALRGEFPEHAVNLHLIGAATLSQIRPFLLLAERLGKFISQFVIGFTKAITIQTCGDIPQEALNSINTAVLKGFLEPYFHETVNYVNAPILIKEREIKVTESRCRDVIDYANLLSVKVTSDVEERLVAGTIFYGHEPRLVLIDDYRVEATPEGHILICFNEDKPGIIGNLGTLLAKENINIAFMTLGRKKAGGEAVTILNLDNPLPHSYLAKIKALPHINEARLVHL